MIGCYIGGKVTDYCPNNGRPTTDDCRIFERHDQYSGHEHSGTPSSSATATTAWGNTSLGQHIMENTNRRENYNEYSLATLMAYVNLFNTNEIPRIWGKLQQ